MLGFQPATITQSAEKVGLAKGSYSYHVRLLERAGLVKVVRTRKVRGVTERHVRMAHLRLAEEQFAGLGARLEALADEYRELSDPSLPDASLVFAPFHPAARGQRAGDAK
ncbi:helix-turn-helix domain-containing protein [Streptomyces antibioticus]|uniref:helix-turn-helix domain-containing protein n=1 Tax=Streptomyces antibioticus TaxID=1890 RepID=UPI0033BF317A